MSKARTVTVRIGVAAATVAALAACSTGGDLETGPARPDGREIAVEAATGRITPTTQWPDACTLLIADELRAILPGAEEIKSRSTSVSPDILPRIVAENGSVRGEVRGGRCAYSMELPGYWDDSRSATTDGTGNFSVILIAVGDPNMMARVYADEHSINKRSYMVDDLRVGGAECYRYRISSSSIAYLTCHKGPVVFSIEQATFRGISLDGAKYHDAFYKAVEDRILVPVAKTVAADLPNG